MVMNRTRWPFGYHRVSTLPYQVITRRGNQHYGCYREWRYTGLYLRRHVGRRMAGARVL